MNSIWVIAKNTYLEIIRDRILYGLLVFALLLIGMSLALGQLSFAEQARIAANFGLASIHMCSVIVSVFLGASLVNREIEKKTILTLLVRPISRLQFLIGKVLGLALIDITAIAGLSIILVLLFFGIGIPLDRDFFLAVHGIFLESFVLLCVTVFFATFSTTIMTVSFGLGVFLIGHWLDSLNYFAEKAETGALPLINLMCKWLLPNLETFNWKSEVVFVKQVALQDFYLANIYAAAWGVFFVAAAALVFRRKDFG